MKTVTNRFLLISKYRSEIMGGAALWIFYFHIFDATLFSGTPLKYFEWWLHRVGFCGVDIFILCSGFGLFYSLKNVTSRKSLAAYYKKRFVRIYSVFLPVAVFFGFVWNWGFREFVGKLTGYTQLTVNIYAFLWYVSFACVLYLVAPLWKIAFSRIKRKQCGVFLWVVALFVLMVATKNLIRSDLFGMISRVPIFLVGYYFGYMAQKDSVQGLCKKPWIENAIIAITLVFGVLYTALINAGYVTSLFPANNSFANIWLAIPIVLLETVIFERFGTWKAIVLIRKVLCFYGVMSLEFYCLQEGIYTIMKQTGLAVLSSPWVCFVVVTILSYGLYRAVHQMLPALNSRFSLDKTPE